ncbi:hypothetical protein Bca101_052935 [Brassica carinata]
MGTCQAVLGLSFPTKKFKALLRLALLQLDLSKPELQNEISGATSNVTKLLRDGQHKKAYREVDVLIQRQNHLDTYNIIRGYLCLLIIETESVKPKRDISGVHFEAVSSLIYAAPRIRLHPCFTAIQDVRNGLLWYFGHKLAAEYIEMRNDSGIHPQIIEKLSKKPSRREVRMRLLEKIAAKENIVLKLGEASTSREGASDNAKLASEKIVEDETRKGCGLSDPVKSRKKKQIDVTDPTKASGNSSKGPENKQSEQEQEGNGDGSAKRGKTTQKAKKKQIDDVAEKALGNPSDGRGNKESEQEGNDDSFAKRGKKKHVAVVRKALESLSKGPENEKSEQEGNDVRSESERPVVSDSEEIIKLDQDIEEWMEKNINIDWSDEESGDVDHLVHFVEETAGFKHPLSVRNKRVPEQ